MDKFIKFDKLLSVGQGSSELWEIDFYREDDGTLPVKTWLDGLPEEVRGKVIARIDLLKKEGQMKTAWDSYAKRQLKKPAVRQAYEEETKVLSIGLQLANHRKRKGLTQAQVAKRIGTSTPQLSRTERRPENVNMRTLMRYAYAVGMDIDIRLVARK